MHIYGSQAKPKPSAKPLLATDPRCAGHAVPSGRAPAFRPDVALRMQCCVWQKRPTPGVLPVAQAGRGSCAGALAHYKKRFRSQIL